MVDEHAAIPGTRSGRSPGIRAESMVGQPTEVRIRHGYTREFVCDDSGRDSHRRRAVDSLVPGGARDPEHGAIDAEKRSGVAAVIRN